MRRVVDAIILVALIVGVGYYWLNHQDQVRVAVRQIETRALPCRTAITYSVGSIDPRFGITQDQVVANLKKAEAIWEGSSGQNLFEYKKTGGDVIVNFVYDRRQASTDTLKETGAQIDQRKATYDLLRSKYDILSSSVRQERMQYQESVAAYETREAMYNEKVASWNSRGGAPRQVFQELQTEKQNLESTLQSVNATQLQLNNDIKALNTLATDLNQLIVELNLHVDQYNQVGSALGEFEEGLYQSEAGKQTIDIYEYSNKTVLIRVLAHELGHALGLDHVADPKAIMYKINEGDSLTLAPQDMSALEAVCHSGVLK